ncbi:MAG: 16S rRNA (guanine(966)-N(2))-methyltransferase RsmD [Aquabacterium sp.]|jgi:16S rRNA (guanine966-N2)-methyltransferase|uniref:16S rRNA (guanine(966)-N(2))-methyltransferase RsmD n=1 Tax=Aquabacterium sp. TaxID=1872578 RepID=UPI001B5D24E6|nr:16S rRNA (guanine(966)-N(2))-methyltransferase RsmD [Aquabacterium sp.]MBP7132078.1 16S rRNA (guanine(966)-N(2))-methyltransferase RsmD [Aquabacterium sp.]
MTKQTPRRSHRPTAVNVGADPVAAARKVARTAAQEVRILGGQWKRTPLPVPVSAGLRPTPSRVRETLFNWLGQDLSGWRILDAFAGTGALGLEAASRGADEVCLLEREPALVRALLATQARLKATQVQVLQVDALNWMNQRQRAGHFDLVFLDPPFEADCFAPALAAASHCVAVGGWVYLEADHTFSDEDAAVLCVGLRRHRHGQAGAVHFHLFQRVAEESHTGVPQV